MCACGRAATGSTWPVAGRLGAGSCWRRQGACVSDFCTSSCRGCRCLVCSFTCKHVASVSHYPTARWQPITPGPQRVPALHVCRSLTLYRCRSDVPPHDMIGLSSRRLSALQCSSRAYLSRQWPVLLGPALPVHSDLQAELRLRQHVRCTQPSCSHGRQGDDAGSARQMSGCSIDPDKILRGEDHMSACVFLGHLALDSPCLGKLKVNLNHKQRFGTAVMIHVIFISPGLQHECLPPRTKIVPLPEHPRRVGQMESIWRFPEQLCS